MIRFGRVGFRNGWGRKANFDVGTGLNPLDYIYFTLGILANKVFDKGKRHRDDMAQFCHEGSTLSCHGLGTSVHHEMRRWVERLGRKDE